MEGLKTVPLPGIFSRGVFQDKAVFNVPESFTTQANNIRIIAGSSVIRKWYNIHATPDLVDIEKPIRGMITNGGEMYVARDKKLQTIAAGAYVDVAGATFSDDYKVEFLTFWPYIIALTGIWYPYVYDIKSSTRTQLTSTNIEVDGKPSIGAIYGYGSYVIGGENGNILYMSRWATKTNQEYVYDRVGSGAEQILLKWWKGIGIAATLNRLFIWTESGIEFISTSTMTTVGGVTTTLTLPLWWENQPMSQRSIIVADEVIYFPTKTWQINTIGYVQGITDPQVGNISQTQEQSLNQFFEWLEEDQSDAFGYYNKKDKELVRYFKRKWAIFNDVCLVFDIVGNNFLIDTNRFGIAGARVDTKYYVWSSINGIVYQVDVGKMDDEESISWNRYSKVMYFGSPRKRKILREVEISGEIAAGATINVDIIVDGNVKYTTTIDGNKYQTLGLGSEPQWSVETWWESWESDVLYPFNKIISRWQIRLKWIWFQFRFYWDSEGRDIVLSDMAVGIKYTDGTELKNKI